MYTPWAEDFRNFDRDIPNPPGPEYSLERIDPRQGYFPGNVTWATATEQGRNKAETVIYRWKEHRGTFVELVEKAGLNYHAAYKRFRRMGWSLEDALETPARAWRRQAG